MQAIKNGIKSTLRTPVKSALFLALFTGLAVLLCVSFCVFGAVSGYIRDANGFFHTVAELEYVGENYPDRTVYDENVNRALSEYSDELSALTRSEAVERFEPEEPDIAVIEGFYRRDGAVYNPNSAVLEVCILSLDEATGQYTAVVSHPYYSLKKMQDRLVHVKLYSPVTERPETELEIGAHYIMAGHLSNGDSPGDFFAQYQLSYTENGELCSTPAYTKTEDGNIAEQEPFLKVAQMLSIQNNGCRVTYTNAIEDTVPFHQSIMRLNKGRLFTEEEYASKARVCIVSSKITGTLGLTVGDTLDMSIFTSGTDLYDPSILTPVDSGRYEIIGIFNEVENYSCQVFLPGLDTRGFVPVTGYTLGRFLLKNELAEGFVMQAAPLLEHGFRLAVYDQGYSAATEPIRELRFICIIFLAVTLLLTVVTLILQSHLFVSRQRDAAQTMDKLGSGKAHICIYFLSSALLLALIAAAAGVVVSKLIEGRVFELIRRFAEQFADQDLRFSYTKLAETRTLEFAPKSSAGVYAAAAAALIAGSLLFTLAFALGALKDRNAKKRRKKARAVKPALRGSTSKLSGPLKYAALSIRRGLVRTLAVILVCLAAAVFFCRLASSLEGYREQLERYKASAVITGYATDYYGRTLDKLSLEPDPMLALTSGDVVSDYCFTKNYGSCTILGVGLTAEGEEFDVSIKIPRTEFARDSLATSVKRDKSIVGTPSLERSTQFRTSGVDITWLEGYDETSFRTLESVCALSERVMNDYGVRLGDSVLLLIVFNGRFDQRLFKVVASYGSSSTAKTVFVPVRALSRFSGEDGGRYVKPGDEGIRAALCDFRPVKAEIDETTGQYISIGHEGIPLSSFTFRLSDTSRLDELRDALFESGYTWVRSGERLLDFAVIDDGVYLNTTHSMQRQIQYVSALYYSLYAAAFMIAAALAWLLTHSRRPEIAVQRALGAQRARIFANFFFEQAFLCSAGLGLGLALSYLLPGGVSRFALTLCAVFLGLWCVSAAICLIMSLRGRETSLSEKE